MAARNLSCAELAAELGRKADWLAKHWPRLVREKVIPPPIMGADGGKLAWNAAQVSAVLDKHLPAALRPAAAAYRAAVAAATESLATAPADVSAEAAIAEARQRLDAQFQPGSRT